jgi:hypothetical protein
MHTQNIYPMRTLFFSLLSFATVHLYAQPIGIGTSAPNAAAQLELQANNKGLLIPRMTIAQRDAIAFPPEGLLVYVTNNNTFSYNAGSSANPAWCTLNTLEQGSTQYNGWRIGGNAGTTASHFLGTRHDADFFILVNNAQTGRMSISNVQLGLQAGRLNNLSQSVAIGREALYNANGNSAIVAIGDKALYSSNPVANEAYNTAIGYRAATQSVNAYALTAVGSNALSSLVSANDNTAIGAFALVNQQSGINNTAFGHRALFNLTSGSNNTALGHFAGLNVTTGSNNTFLGTEADVTAGNGNLSNATAIGHQTKVSSSNTMAFGNANVTKWAFNRYSTDANMALQVGTDASNGNGAYLTSAGNWVNTSDVHKKENFSPVPHKALMQQLKQLPVTQWKYNGSEALHIGPMAQDFYTLFGVGADDKTISTVDAAGVVLAALQALVLEHQELKAALNHLQAQK